jgi:hypothetical protein
LIEANTSRSAQGTTMIPGGRYWKAHWCARPAGVPFTSLLASVEVQPWGYLQGTQIVLASRAETPPATNIKTIIAIPENAGIFISASREARSLSLRSAFLIERIQKRIDRGIPVSDFRGADYFDARAKG